jgi:nitrogen fixation protein NifU and related proteins
MTQLYQQQLMDHYRNPRNQGTLDKPDFKSGVFNPSCGDSIAIEGMVQDHTLVHIAFQGSGCVVSQATASLLTQVAKGKELDEIMQLDKHTVLLLIGMELGPVRLKCALLPLQALHEGVQQYQNK